MKRHGIFLAIIGSFLITTPAWAESSLEAVTQAVAEAVATGKAWDGPTHGPTLQKDKKVIFIASDLKNGGVQGVEQGLSEAAAVAGWRMDTLDGAGSVKDQLSALNQAIAQKPDGIVIGGWDPNVATIPLKKAAQLGIVLIGWHAVPEPGPNANYGLFYNVTSDSHEVARIAAQYAIVKSQGKARALIFTDSLYQIAQEKARIIKEELEKCAECQVLELIDTPLADTASRMPALTFSLLQKYGDTPWYALAINDLYFDFMVPALKTAGKGEQEGFYNISAGDGSISAFQRIRSAEGQLATVAEPLRLHGWQILDEFNRAFAQQPPSGYVVPVHLVTSENILLEGGKDNQYDPQNNYQDHYKAIWGVEARR